MYPLGFLTMTSYLEARGLRVRVVNLALRMMNDPLFDVPAFLRTLKPRAVGIDLHWLPHAHGAIEVADIVRAIHPTVPIIFGGLSSTYFHEELIQYAAVDYVLRGNAVEPPLYQLLRCLAAGTAPETVPNLTWKEAGQVRINAQSFVPHDLDYADINPAQMVKMVLRHRDLGSVLPFNGWWQNPITAVFTAKGCAHECVTCGSSSHACTIISQHKRPRFRTPANLVQNIVDISRISKGPIFLVGDLRQAGDDYAHEVLTLLRKTRTRNQIVFELFEMPPLAFLQAIDAAVRSWSLELSPESHDETVRHHQDSATTFSNAEMEAVIQAALDLNCTRVDVFFMIGLPRQTAQSVAGSIDYCAHLFRRFDRRLSCFISPMGPFLDPGSHVFEEPERFGYHLFAHTLEEHRQLLVQPTWERILNYETDWMSQAQLVNATYDAAERLNHLKLQYGRIKPAQGKAVAERIQRARTLKARLDDLVNGDPIDPEVRRLLQGEVHEFSVSTICDKKELFWRRHLINFRVLGILRVVLAYLRD